MAVCHFTFLESFYDIFEFTSKLKQQEKQEKLKKLKRGNRVMITEKTCHDLELSRIMHLILVKM